MIGGFGNNKQALSRVEGDSGFYHLFEFSTLWCYGRTLFILDGLIYNGRSPLVSLFCLMNILLALSMMRTIVTIYLVLHAATKTIHSSY